MWGKVEKWIKQKIKQTGKKVNLDLISVLLGMCMQRKCCFEFDFVVKMIYQKICINNLDVINLLFSIISS